ncbi:MAG: hypothetical protein NUW37_00835 [Planctomycetes bacterium]|nr:hypothetical protein [Planctomycetota bacterium]
MKIRLIILLPLIVVSAGCMAPKMSIKYEVVSNEFREPEKLLVCGITPMSASASRAGRGLVSIGRRACDSFEMELWSARPKSVILRSDVMRDLVARNLDPGMIDTEPFKWAEEAGATAILHGKVRESMTDSSAFFLSSTSKVWLEIWITRVEDQERLFEAELIITASGYSQEEAIGELALNLAGILRKKYTEHAQSD